MPQPEPAGAPDWSGLEREVRALALRVQQIEQRLDMPAPVLELGQPPAGEAAAATEPGLEQVTVSALPLAGRALLGLAGAYLLRALTESDTLSVGVGVAIGICYAILWLIWAARTPVERRMETALHSVTAALVLAPLLWEATLRFHAISTRTAGALLLAFTLIGLAVSWRKRLLAVATITMLAGLGTAAALLMATHDVLPFTFVFLGVAAAVEISACLDHWLSERWLAASMADLSVLLVTWLVTNARGLPPAYAPIPQPWLLAAQAALLGIYLSSTMVRTLLRGFTFTGFETAQCALAFLIGVGGGLSLSKEAQAISAMALACAAACYLVAFAHSEYEGSHSRNFHTYSTFGLLLAVTGTRILLPGGGAPVAWAALAAVCVWAGGRFGRFTLRVHGVVYLGLALVASGALARAAALLLGAEASGAAQPALWAGAAAAGACYALACAPSSDPRLARVARAAMAGMLTWLAAGSLAGVLTAGYHAAFGASSSHAYCATLRTGVLTAGGLALAWTGGRRKNWELAHLAYPMMALGAYRLLAEDLRQERKGALFLSLLVYGAALTALPRVGRRTA
ncbi:MAG TPA: hypothetical protein VMU19_01410 [Bryobacteraceae bacterium]|nr:hypothetical protein [Bryobacteraceae bacterium]